MPKTPKKPRKARESASGLKKRRSKADEPKVGGREPPAGSKSKTGRPGSPTVTNINRRRFERQSVPPMYTPVIVGGVQETTLEGHGYDISEGGLQLELDRAVAPGTHIEVRVTLPGHWTVSETERTIRALCSVVWVDESEPGPVRMAVEFKAFGSKGDHERLSRLLGGMRGRGSTVAA